MQTDLRMNVLDVQALVSRDIKYRFYVGSMQEQLREYYVNYLANENEIAN